MWQGDFKGVQATFKSKFKHLLFARLWYKACGIVRSCNKLLCLALSLTDTKHRVLTEMGKGSRKIPSRFRTLCEPVPPSALGLVAKLSH